MSSFFPFFFLHFTTRQCAPGRGGKGNGRRGRDEERFLNVLEKSDKFFDSLPNMCISRVQVCQISIIRKPLKIHIETHECKCTYKHIYFYMFTCIFISASFNDEEEETSEILFLFFFLSFFSLIIDYSTPLSQSPL